MNKWVLLCGASISAWGVVPGVALAQEVMPDPQTSGPEIVVVGERARNEAAIGARRDTLNVYDSVSIDEIGRLPDLNVPDAFRRVPGVTAIFDEDEGRFVSARGLPTSYNHVTVDGLALATIGAFGDGGRDVNLETIPSTAVRRLEVFKTFTPEIDAGAVGGYFNLVTRSAFDAPEDRLILDAALAYYTFDDVPDDNAFPGANPGGPGVRAQLTSTNRFGAEDQFGLVFSASYQRKTRDEEKVIPDRYHYLGSDSNGDGLGDTAVPAQYRWYVYTNRAERFGGNLKLEWRPTPATELSFNNFVYFSRENETRSGHQISGIDVSDITTDTPETGSFANAYGEVTVNLYPLDYDYTGHSLRGRHEFADGSWLSAGIGYSTARINDRFPEFFARTPTNRPELGGTYDLTGNIPQMTINDPSYFLDIGNYTVNLHRNRTRDTEEKLWDVRIDYGRNEDGRDPGWGYAVGAEYRTSRRTNDLTIEQYRSGYIAGDIAVDAPPSYIPPGRDVPFLFVDYSKVRDLADFTIDEVASAEQSLASDFRYEEKIAAGYARLSYSGLNWRVAGGLRYDHAWTRAFNFRRTPAAEIDIFERVRRDGDYGSFLPSIIGSYDVTPALRLKAAASRTLSRPAPGDLAGTETLSADGTTLSRGNSDLRPRKSNNFDLAAEYYFNDGDGLATIGVFYKDISDEIVVRAENIQIDGQLVRVTQPVNAESSRVFGVEAALIKNDLRELPESFGFLRNIGFSANITWTDARITLDSSTHPIEKVDYLLDQPEWFGNASVFYGFDRDSELRLAYTFQSDYHEAISASPASQAGWRGARSLDFSARIGISDALRLNFEARNLTNENRLRLMGPGLAELRENVEFGRSFFFGFTYTP